MHIVFVGLSGVPYLGRACDPRLSNTANILTADADVTIVNRYSSSCRSTMSGIDLSPKVSTVELLSRRHTGRLLSALLFFVSVLIEPYRLVALNRKNKIHWLHIYSGHYFDFLWYRMISRLIGAKVVYQYVEYRTEKGSRGLYHNVNSRLCDFHGAKLWDACISISNFLEQSAKRINPDLPILKVTPIADFNVFDANEVDIDVEEEYVMFCGSASYFEVIRFIADSYRASSICKSKRLLLVLGGNDTQVQAVKDYIPEAIILRKLPYEKLVAYYKHAYALLIPLRNTIEDIARFPNKICEYTAAHGLIVTTNIGEMQYYFRDGENAVVADEYSVQAYAKCLDSLASADYDIDTIKANSYATGLKFFSKEAYKDKLYSFLNQ